MTTKRKADGTWPKLSQGERRPVGNGSLRIREAELRAELPAWIFKLEKRAKRFRIAATRSDRANTGNLRAEAMRVVAQALCDAAALLDQRQARIVLRSDYEINPGKPPPPVRLKRLRKLGLLTSNPPRE